MKSIFEKSLSALSINDMEAFESSIKEDDVLNFVDEEERTLLFYAVIQGQLEAVNKLINKSIKINLKDKNGWTPLHYAVNEHHTEIVELLLNKGAEVNAKDDFGNTVIWRAVFASRGRGDIIKILINNNADPAIKNSSGISALILAETIGNYNVKQFLIP